VTTAPVEPVATPPVPPPQADPTATAAPAATAAAAPTNASVPAAKGPAKTAPATKATPSPVPPSPPAAAPDRVAEARERLDVARAKLASGLTDQGVADLRQIVLDFPGSPVGIDASFLAADTLDKAGRPDDAMGVLVEFERRYSGTARIAESKLRRARQLQASKVQTRQGEGYALYGEIARDFPGSPEARTALQAKRQIENQRKQLRATDPVLNIEVPALLVTLRAMGDQFPGEPTTMVALNQLATAYEDMDRYQAAADVWERMASQFAGNPMEVWYRLGELYERRLRNPEKAREAYGKVPADSPRYRDAQQRLKRQ
jgi:tetratricopeptide (TPR) repeat protein